MHKYKPRVSLGVPVFNGENYLRECLDAILSQTFTDYEVVISDNASTDRTGDICREYAARDSRIRYIRQENNIGASKNFNTVFELSQGEYFKWTAHDDIIAPEFLERCVDTLDKDPSAVLCYSKIVKIDGDGKQTGLYDLDNEIRIDSFMPHERFRDLIDIPHWCIAVFGLVRYTVLRRTPLIGSHIGSDRTLLAELGLIGRFGRIPEYLFSRRDHNESSIGKFKVLQARWAWFDPRMAGRIPFPYWRYALEYYRSVRKAPLSWTDRYRCGLRIIIWAGKKRRWLYKDLKVGAVMAINRTKWGNSLLNGLDDGRRIVRETLHRSKMGQSLLEARRQILRHLR